MSRAAVLLGLLAWPHGAYAHVSERALVLLLPTDVYIASGMGVMIATVALLVFLPPALLNRAFAIKPLNLPRPRGALATSCASTLFVFATIAVGFWGARDPLTNPLTLTIWTVLWTILPLAHAVFGNIWRWANPWTGLYAALGTRPVVRYPLRLGSWPAVAVFLAFALFMVADIAPADPARLATLVSVYWLVVYMGLILMGPRFLLGAEPFTALFRLIGRFAPIWRRGIAAPGTRLIGLPLRPGMGALALLWLGIGSFDGLNETFWWLAQIGINPLAFLGRSAVATDNALGLVAAVLLLFAVFIGASALGLRVAGLQANRPLVSRLMLTVLPIALGYHLAHYLTQVLVSSQYLLVALSDPFGTGADWLGLGDFFVSTGFFNRPGSVRAIWLTQASAVVLGHCLAVVLAHKVALQVAPTRSKATLSQLPVALFMVAYTFFGLWLLAQPTGA